MSRPAKFTDEQVIEAGYRVLERKGGNLDEVTGWLIRQELGSGQAARYEKIWQSRPDAAPAPAPAVVDAVLPPEVDEALKLVLGDLPEQIESLVKRCNTAAVQTAEGRVKATMDQLNEQAKKFEQKDAQANDAIAEAETRIDELDGLVGTLQGRVAELERDKALVDQQLLQAQESLDVTEAAREKLDGKVLELGEELADVKQSLAIKSSEVQAKSALIEKLEKTKDRLTEENGAYKTKFNTARVELGECEKQLKALDDENSDLEKAVSACGAKLEEAQANVERLDGELTTANTKIGERDGELKLLKARLSDVETVIKQHKTAEAEALEKAEAERVKTSARDQKIRDLEKQLGKEEQARQEAEDRYHQLAGENMAKQISKSGGDDDESSLLDKL